MSFYGSKVDLVERMLKAYGQAATLTKANTVFDGSTGDVTNNAAATPIQVATFEYKLRDIDGTNVLIGDQKCYISAKPGVAPAKADKITIGGVDWQLIVVSPLAPGGTAVLYESQIRRQ